MKTDRSPGTVLVPMGYGEIVDRTTILEIKAVRIAGPVAESVRRELAVLKEIEELVPKDAEILSLRTSLRKTNEALWDVEDALRVMEADDDFGSEFVGLARQVIALNSLRSRLKQKINEKTGSSYGEAKLYKGNRAFHRDHDE